MSTPKTHAQWLNRTAVWLLLGLIGGCCCVPAGIPFIVAGPSREATIAAAIGVLAFTLATCSCLTMGISCYFKAVRTPR